MLILTPTRCRGGFTLLELLIVIGVISVLLGLSIGYIGKTDPLQVAASILAGERRAAQLTARAEGVPTEVMLRPGRDDGPATVEARLLSPVVSFHFEPDQDYLDEALRPVIAGQDVPGGRFGHARRPRDGERSPLLRWPVTPGLADLRDGFVMRFDLWCERRQAATLLLLQPTLEVTVDDELRVRARCKVHTQGSEGASTVAVRSELGLPVRRWCTLDVACDGQSLWVSLDGRELGRAVADGTPQQEPASTFELSPADAPWPGAIDEVRVFVFSWSPAQELPYGLRPAQLYRFGYDMYGEPVNEPTVRYLSPEEG